MPKKPRRSKTTDDGSHYAYPGLNLRPLARGSGAPLSGRAKAAYLTLVIVLIAAIVIAPIVLPTNS